MKLDKCCSWVRETSAQIHPYTHIHTVDRRIVHRLISSLSHYLQGLYIPGGAGYLQSTASVMSSKNLEGIFLLDHKNGWQKWLWNNIPKDPILLSCWEWTHGTYINRKVTKWEPQKKQIRYVPLNPGCLMTGSLENGLLILLWSPGNWGSRIPQWNEWKLRHYLDPERWEVHSHFKHV